MGRKGEWTIWEGDRTLIQRPYRICKKESPCRKLSLQHFACSAWRSAGNSRDRVTRNALTLNFSTNQCQVSCPLCKLKHSLDKCSAFLSMIVINWWRYLTRGKRCFVCLSQGDTATEYKLSKRCGSQGCSELHHELPHKGSQKLSHSINATERVMTLKHYQEGVSLGVIVVYVIGTKGKQLTYALVDNGTDFTFISKVSQ